MHSLEKASDGTLSPFARNFDNALNVWLFVKTHSHDVVNTKNTGLEQKDSIHKQSTVEYTDKHANRSQIHIKEQNEHQKTHKILFWENQLNLSIRLYEKFMNK